MWIRWYGECLRLSLSKPQLVLETIIWINYNQPKNQRQRTVKQLFDVTRKLNGVRMEKILRIHYIADSRRDPQHDDWNTMWTWEISRKNHLVQRHCMGRKRKRRFMYYEFQNRSRICKKIRARTWSFLGRDSSIVWIHTQLIPYRTFEQFKATLEENTEIQHCKTTCCYRTTSLSTSATLEAPTICTRSFRGNDVKKGRHAVFWTAVNPMFIDQHVTKPRIAVYKNNWKIHHNAVYRCNLRVAQSEGLHFYQTRSNVIILYST